MSLLTLQRQLTKIIFGAFIFALIPNIVSAQEIRGLEVAPFLIELDVAKGGTVESHIDLINHSTNPLVITASPRDFLPGEDGQPQFVPDPQKNNPTFSLSSWVKLSTPETFTVNPGQLVTVNFSVNPPKDAEQGTHYGALLFSYSGKLSEGSVSEVNQSVGTILLVYYGQGRENGSVRSASDKKFVFSPDKVTFTERFSNTGNVHVKPKGEVKIKNMFGQIVSTPQINRDAANILPLSERTFITSWFPSSFSFGRYTAQTVLVYGRGKLEAKDTVVIWVLPWYLDLIVIFVVALLLWIIFHGRHLHKRRVIRKHLEKTQSE